MKKFFKILTLILAAVMLLSVLAGCVLFPKNAAKYRDVAFMKVGDTEVKLGKLVDMFQNLRITYAQYIAQGQISLDNLFEMAMNTLYNEYTKVDSYLKTDPATYTNDYLAEFKNAKYLTADEMQYVVAFVKHSLFTVFDEYAETFVKAEYGLAAAEEEDTSRDFTEPDDMRGAATYAEKLYKDKFDRKDLDEYFAKYYAEVELTELGYDGYVYASESDLGLTAKLTELNKRIKKNYIEEKGEQKDDFVFPTVNATEYIEWQNKAVKKYERTMKSVYEISLDEFYKQQVSDIIDTVLTYKYDLNVSDAVEKDKAALAEQLSENYASAVTAANADYNTNPDSFKSFIEGLTATSFIYNVPSSYQGKYVFVKNLLIPFTAKQSALLKNYAETTGGTDNDAYLQYRTEIAAQIEATDFLNEDEDAEAIKNLFVLENGQVKINESGALGEYFKADGVVNPMTKDGETLTVGETFIELMKQFNTDTAQHSATYDYVVRAGDVPADYTSSWVEEFVDATNAAVALGQNHYAVCISTYGIHIVLYVKPVAAEAMNFADNLYDTTSAEYRYFKTYYNDQIKIYTEEATDALDEEYKKGGKITVNNEFKKFLKENGITYDFDKAMKGDDEEENS